jgi:hypothetical protein
LSVFESSLTIDKLFEHYVRLLRAEGLGHHAMSCYFCTAHRSRGGGGPIAALSAGLKARERRLAEVRTSLRALSAAGPPWAYENVLPTSSARSASGEIYCTRKRRTPDSFSVRCSRVA